MEELEKKIEDQEIKIKEQEQRIEEIEKRNKRVELDKKWETSLLRRALICILTYLVVIIYSYLVFKYNNIYFSSLVPVIGFGLSTLSLKLVRKVWEKYNN